MARIKKLLDQRSWTKAAVVDSMSKDEEPPAFDKQGLLPHLLVPNQTHVTADEESGAASDAVHDKVSGAQDVPPKHADLSP